MGKPGPRCVLGTLDAPAFLLGGTPQSAWTFGPYVIGVLAVAVILTPMFNAARGSILVAALFHFQQNNPIWPDAQPWEIQIVLLQVPAAMTKIAAVSSQS